MIQDLKELSPKNEENPSTLLFARQTLVSYKLKELAKSGNYPELDKLVPELTQKRGLLFTNVPQSKIEKLLKEKYSALLQDPQAGDIAPKKVVVAAGIKEDMPFSLEERLTRLGLPIKVEKVRKDSIFCPFFENYSICLFICFFA